MAAINPALASWHIDQLRGMTVAQADRALCNMHTDLLLDMGAVLCINLPLVGGDKPICILAAIFHA